MAAERIVTLPPAMVEGFHRLEDRSYPEWFATSDPSRPLGSGGGTAHALLAAWRRSGEPDFYSWLTSSKKMVVHAGGQSRRLPAYASIGKALMPIPALRGSAGQRPDQALIDLQVSVFDDLFEMAPAGLRVMILSGDSILLPKRWPDQLPDADVVCLGLRADAETSRDFGAFYLQPGGGDSLEFCLQKPDPVATRAQTQGFDCVLDAGVWLLSEQAVRALLLQCGIADPNLDSDPEDYDLYTDFGRRMGRVPTIPEPEVSRLEARIVAVQGQFLHFGTTRQLIESVTALHDQSHHGSPLGFLTSAKRGSNQHVQNVEFSAASLRPGESYWLENSTLTKNWTLAGDNVITGVPANSWDLNVPRGACIDIVPIEDTGFCARVYGIDDAFRGAISAESTQFLGGSLGEWLRQRGLTWADIASAGDLDIQLAPLFPVLDGDSDLDQLGGWVDWMISESPDPSWSDQYRSATRLSAAQILTESNSDRAYAQRRALMARSLVKMRANHRESIFYSLDLERTAEWWHKLLPDVPPVALAANESLVKRMHDAMFRSALHRLNGDSIWEAAEQSAFALLRDAILESQPPAKVPLCGVAPDQMVWGRSPVRLDLAGGWTDTPPYCLLNGGKVLNLAVNLNGQPPIQVFIRRSDRLVIRLRSIDLGTELQISTFEELGGDVTEKSEFSLAQAALGLAGFSSEMGEPSLEQNLARFGGGIEMSLLAAVPKGSGLGTSSILASTILAALGEFCSLGWSSQDVMAKTLALEQILSSGGGWQDQSGGCLPGIKELETLPGLIQSPTCRWLPDRILGPETANRSALLYYTGITRVAKSVLREIVRGMFLNSGSRLRTLRRIGENVDPVADAIRRNDWDDFGHLIKRSWELNQELDSGTNPTAVQEIIDRVQEDLLSVKLLGAGGGGFLLFIAKNPEAGQRIRATLESDPPAPNARFFEFSVSQVGLEVTKS